MLEEALETTKIHSIVSIVGLLAPGQALRIRFTNSSTERSSFKKLASTPNSWSRRWETQSQLSSRHGKNFRSFHVSSSSSPSPAAKWATVRLFWCRFHPDAGLAGMLESIDQWRGRWNLTVGATRKRHFGRACRSALRKASELKP